MGIFFPGTFRWYALIGDLTSSLNNSVLTIPANQNEVFRSTSYDFTTGLNLQKILWVGSASGNINVRFSEHGIPSSDDRLGILLPKQSECSLSYIPSNGLTPDQDGWAGSGVGTLFPTYFNMTGATYFNKLGGLSATKKHIYGIHWIWRRNAGHNGVARLVYYTRFTGQNGGIIVDIQENGNITAYPNSEILGVAPIGQWVYCALILRSGDAVNCEKFDFYIGNVTGPDDFDVHALFNYGKVDGFDAGGSAYVYIGNTGGGTINVDYGEIRSVEFPLVCDKFGWEAVNNGATSFSRNDQFVQFKGNTLGGGSLTSLALITSLTPPTRPLAVEVSPIDDSTLAYSHDAVIGVAGYLAQLIDSNDVVVDSSYHLNSNGVFSAISPETYRVKIYSFSDSGVLSSFGRFSTTQTLPVPAGISEPNQPTLINVFSLPNRPGYIGVL